MFWSELHRKPLDLAARPDLTYAVEQVHALHSWSEAHEVMHRYKYMSFEQFQALRPLLVKVLQLGAESTSYYMNTWPLEAVGHHLMLHWWEYHDMPEAAKGAK